MTEKRFFPTSIVDEVAYLFEVSTQSSLTYGFIITLEGEVSSEIVREALDACLNLYPKFKCVLVNHYPSLKRWFRYSWEYRDVKSEDILEEIEDLDLDQSRKDAISYLRHYHFSHSIEITREIPLKLMLIRRPRWVNLIFFSHHAVGDGLGFFSFLQSFIKIYEEIFYHQKKEGDYYPDFKAISRPESRFQQRHFSLRHYYAYLKHSALLLREPSAQVQAEGGGDSMKELPAAVEEITPHQLKKIRTTVKKYHTTVNHYLLAAMFNTIKKWNQQWGKKSERIYINVPVNLRSPEERTLGNILSGFNISFRSELIGDKEKMLRLIREEQTSMMESDLARTNVNLTWFLKPIPLKLKMLMFKHLAHTFYPTFTLSNMGICHPNSHHKDEEGFYYMGPARICSISAIANPVIWPQMVVLTYNDRMAMSLSVSRSRFSLEAAERFLDSFMRELLE